MKRPYRQLILAALIALCLGCSDVKQTQAEELYNVANRFADKREYDKAVDVLQRVVTDYDGTTFAQMAEKDIPTYQELQSLLISNQASKIETAFSGIGRALENYNVRFLSYPMTPQDLEKLPAVVVPDWTDVWDNRILYKPTYSAPDIPKTQPDGYVLASFGQDGLPGGVGENKDYFYRNGQSVPTIVE